MKAAMLSTYKKARNLLFVCLLSILGLLSCTSLNKATKQDCEKDNYAEETLEILPEGYIQPERVSSTIINLFKEAVGIANLIIDGNSQSAARGIKRLVPIVTPNDLYRVRCDGIPVYWSGNVKSPPCEVPSKKRVIVVDQMFPEIYSTTFYVGNILDSLQSIKLSHLLAISLLHELGHIANDDYNKYASWEDIMKGNSPNTDTTATKTIEQAADDFASFELLRACQDDVNFSRRAMGFVLANTMSLAIFNLNAKRKQEIQAGLYTSVADYYKDKGYTHVNLDLRYRQIFHIATMQGGSSITDFFQKRTGH